MENNVDEPQLKYDPEEESISLEDTARSLGIPRERWDNPVVRQFVSIVNHAERLQAEADDARGSAPLQVSTWPASERAQQYFETNALQPPLADRYGSVELLLRVAGAILKDGLKGGPPIAENPDYIQGKLNAAVARYGLRVIPKSQEM